MDSEICATILLAMGPLRRSISVVVLGLAIQVTVCLLVGLIIPQKVFEFVLFVDLKFRHFLVWSYYSVCLVWLFRLVLRRAHSASYVITVAHMSCFTGWCRCEFAPAYFRPGNNSGVRKLNVLIYIPNFLSAEILAGDGSVCS